MLEYAWNEELRGLKKYYATGMYLIKDRWQSYGWTIEAHSFEEAVNIAQNDKNFRMHSLTDSTIT